MDIGGLFIVSAVTVWAVMTAAYFFATSIKNLGLVDIFWGLGFMFVGLAVQQAIGSDVNQAFVVVWGLVMLWGARLAVHIGSRFKAGEEDWRYAKMRKSWGGGAWWQSYFRVFMLQGLLMLAVAAPIYLAPQADTLNYQISLGAAVWVIGFVFEAVSDYQLRRFVSSKSSKDKDRFIDSGLWRFSRHPNYFGEVTQWWGLFIIVATASNWWLALLSPITITFLILKVSGIPMLEQRWKDNKAFAAYAKRTNAFFPWIPRA